MGKVKGIFVVMNNTVIYESSPVFYIFLISKSTVQNVNSLVNNEILY